MHEYTGETIKRNRPSTYKAVVEDLAHDQPVLTIARKHRINDRTVVAIRKREADKITRRKKDLALMFENICEKSIRRATKTVKTASYAQAMVGAGIAAQRMLELRGEHNPDRGLTINLLNLTQSGA